MITNVLLWEDPGTRFPYKSSSLERCIRSFKHRVALIQLSSRNSSFALTEDSDGWDFRGMPHLLQHEKHPLRIKYAAKQGSLTTVTLGTKRALYLQRLKLFETSELVLVDIQKRVGR